MYFLNIINSIGDSYLAWKNVYNIIGKILVIMMRTFLPLYNKGGMKDESSCGKRKLRS